MHYIQKRNGMYVLSRNDIEQIATEQLKQCAPLNLERPMPLNTQHVLENHLGLLVKYKYICDIHSGILGLTVMGDQMPIPSYNEQFCPVVLEETFGTVLITRELLGNENLPRRRYTEMHEASHFILHRPYFKCLERSVAARSEIPCPFVVCRNVEIERRYQKTDDDWLEYQADALAAAMLMPQSPFTSCVQDTLRKYGLHAPYLLITSYSDQKKADCIIYDIAQTFLVSYKAAQIRMKHLGLMRELHYCY